MNEIENIVRLYIAFPLWNYLQKKTQITTLISKDNNFAPYSKTMIL